MSGRGFGKLIIPELDKLIYLHYLVSMTTGYTTSRRAAVAPMVEREVEDLRVGGSSPSGSTNRENLIESIGRIRQSSKRGGPGDRLDTGVRLSSSPSNRPPCWECGRDAIFCSGRKIWCKHCGFIETCCS